MSKIETMLVQRGYSYPSIVLGSSMFDVRAILNFEDAPLRLMKESLNMVLTVVLFKF